MGHVASVARSHLPVSTQQRLLLANESSQDSDVCNWRLESDYRESWKESERVKQAVPQFSDCRKLYERGHDGEHVTEPRLRKGDHNKN
jgi:hypothetical protein